MSDNNNTTTTTTKKIVITGGTGHIGSVIALRLGVERVVLFTRASSVVPEELKGVETIVVDLTNKDEVTKACQGKGGIIHLACSLNQTDTIETREKIEINGALNNLLDAALVCDIPLVYASSIAARWCSPEGALINHLPASTTEFNNPLYAMGSYSRSKQMGEELIQKKMKENPSLRACSVLPSAVYGCSPRLGLWNDFLVKTLQASAASPFDRLFNPLVWVKDVAEVFVQALEKGEKKGEAYPCYGGNIDKPHVRDWLNALAKELEYDVREEGGEGQWTIENSITETELGVKFHKIEEIMDEFKPYLEEKGLIEKK